MSRETLVGPAACPTRRTPSLHELRWFVPMASLDTLPPDQRAVIELVLRRGRSYDDIARLLAIDRAAVRARALAAFDGIGPDTGLAPESRALITDYLLGQLPDRVAEQTRDRLAESPYERAWARVLASELGPVTSNPLPEIPDGNARPSSRRGGAIFLVVGAVVAVVVGVVLFLTLSGGSSKHSSTGTAAAKPTTTGTSTAASGTTPATTGTTSAKVVAQVNLNPPGGTGSAKGVAFIVKAGNANGIVIEAQGVAPNSHNAYAVWLSNTPSDSVRVGFVNPGVGKNGRLQTGGALPANAAQYKNVLLTLETQGSPKTPGTVVLEGQLNGLS
jgi:Sigma-70, region 4